MSTLKLNDAQLILLSGAAKRDDGSAIPLPASLADGGERTSKAVAALIKRGLIEERGTHDAASAYRIDGDLRFGLFITDAGKAAIGLGDGEPVSSPSPKPPRTSKSAEVIALLERERGATLEELIEATGWLPHSTRAALTGLRKKGHLIERTKRDDHTCYRIAVSA